jgi:hypothetical protein
MFRVCVSPFLIYCPDPKGNSLNAVAFLETAILIQQCYESSALSLPDDFWHTSYGTTIARPQLQHRQWIHIRSIIRKAVVVLAETGRFIPQRWQRTI